MAIQKIKNLGALLELSNSTANSAYSLKKWAKWAKLAVLFSWYLRGATAGKASKAWALPRFWVSIPLIRNDRSKKMG